MKERQNREEMEALLALRQSEGLTYRELAERSGIPTHTLNYWAMKFRKESQVNEDEPELLIIGGGTGAVQCGCAVLEARKGPNQAPPREFT